MNNVSEKERKSHQICAHVLQCICLCQRYRGNYEMSEWIVVIACSNLKGWKEVVENTGNVLLKEYTACFFYRYKDVR